jgi:rare lipoprotein A (peptidoglycan hydrolase)
MWRCVVHGLAFAALIGSPGVPPVPNYSVVEPTLHIPAKRGPEIKKEFSEPQSYQIGAASWYAEPFDGKLTASGEPYDMYDMTAAHKTIPLGTYVMVTNLQNGRAVVVRVNDRGPMVHGRIIDLSYGAAEALHFGGKGLQRIRIDPVKPRP